MPLFSPKPLFEWSADSEGLAICFFNPKQHAKAKRGQADEAAQLGLVRMQMLVESGQAEVREVGAGIFIAAADAVRLDLETREGFLLPPAWPGGLRLRTESVPQSAGFTARLSLVDAVAGVQSEWKLRGPILENGGSDYLPTAGQYAAVLAFQNWCVAGQRDELANLSLLATLREAHEAGCHIDLEAYRETIIANAQELSVDVRPDADGSGGLILRPIVAGNFPSLDADEIENRLGQLSRGTTRTVLRVGKTIIVLDPTQTRQARALAERRRVPPEQVPAFRENPAVWMAEHVFPDVETEFSPRVVGIDVWTNVYAGAMWEKGEDWFGKKPQPERKPSDGDSEAGNGNARDQISTDPEAETKVVVPVIADNDKTLIYGGTTPQKQADDEPLPVPDFTRYPRVPMAHQQEAVNWLLREHAGRALRRREGDVFGAGALLADDMGLGKTFSTLIFLREWFDLWRARFGGEPAAVLIVAPLSLLGNWKAEITRSYGEGSAVFRRVLIAQSDEDLRRVLRRPGARDLAVPGGVLEYGLGFGDGTERSVDLPGGCVLTTYQTLRDYRFSFAKADWSAAIFDEAQNLKNPNALQTIAAKSLKALFRLTLTGTPVENHLGDFWSILDASEPGPLGSFAEFNQRWIKPMVREPGRAGEIGLQLREHVGELMLRRMKAETNANLPRKSGHDQAIAVEMSPEQRTAYDAVINSVADDDHETEGGGRGHQNRQLAALWHLRQISLHPDLLAGGSIRTANNARESRHVLGRSGKLTWLLQQLDEIRSRGEKVLVFCVQKKLQEALARHLSLIYGIRVPVINGETKATSHRDPEGTRLGLIDEFSKMPGFAVCILSPIAAGAGLNIVAANHVVHLERHWNPAKEDQATDRAYRIGQHRPVHVYLPATRYPQSDRRSFDDVLHGLIEKKRGLQGALGLVPPQAVSDNEIIEGVLASGQASSPQPLRLDLEAVLRLSWKLFEALVAKLYEPDAQRVILTPGSNDRGCDVVVLGWGELRENVLIQCKSTSQDTLDSEVAVREVIGAEPFYANALGIEFQRRRLHTNARRIGKRTDYAARLSGVSVHDRSWLATELARTQLTVSDLLARNGARERL